MGRNSYGWSAPKFATQRANNQQARAMSPNRQQDMGREQARSFGGQQPSQYQQNAQTQMSPQWDNGPQPQQPRQQQLGNYVPNTQRQATGQAPMQTRPMAGQQQQMAQQQRNVQPQRPMGGQQQVMAAQQQRLRAEDGWDGGGGGGGGTTGRTLPNPYRSNSGKQAPNDSPSFDYQYQPNEQLRRWQEGAGAGYQTPGNYMDENFRDSAEGYSQLYQIPLQNALNADRASGFNEYLGRFNATEQARINTGRMNLEERGANREDDAFGFAKFTNGRDFTEGRRQFDATTGNDRLWKEGQIGIGQQQNANTRYGMGLQDSQARLTNDTNRYGLGLQDKQQMRANDTDRYGMGLQNEQSIRSDGTNRYGMSLQDRQASATNATNRYGLDIQDKQNIRADSTDRYGMSLQDRQAGATNATNRYGIDAQGRQAADTNATNRYGMGLQDRQAQATNTTNRYGLDLNNQQSVRTDATNRYGLQSQDARNRGQTANEQYSNQTQRSGVANQYDLGQRQLGFQGRELDTNEAFRRSQLGQEANLTREKFQNDLTQSRYSAFGRAKQPNFKAVRSWG